MVRGIRFAHQGPGGALTINPGRKSQGTLAPRPPPHLTSPRPPLLGYGVAISAGTGEFRREGVSGGARSPGGGRISRESEARAGPQGSGRETAWMRASVSPSRCVCVCGGSRGSHPGAPGEDVPRRRLPRAARQLARLTPAPGRLPHTNGRTRRAYGSDRPARCVPSMPKLRSGRAPRQGPDAPGSSPIKAPNNPRGSVPLPQNHPPPREGGSHSPGLPKLHPFPSLG